jgi:hypothetical protein
VCIELKRGTINWFWNFQVGAALNYQAGGDSRTLAVLWVRSSGGPTGEVVYSVGFPLEERDLIYFKINFIARVQLASDVPGQSQGD